MMMIVLILEVRKWGQTAYLTRLGGGESGPRAVPFTSLSAKCLTHCAHSVNDRLDGKVKTFKCQI